MTVSEKEEQLFEKWQQKGCQFVRDGIVDEGVYWVSYPKVLFILKDPNTKPNSKWEWDLRPFLRRGGKPRTWNNIARWTAAIRALPERIP